MYWRRFGLVAVALGWLTAGCRQGPAPSDVTSGVVATNQQVYSVKGVVKEIKIDGQTAVIQHEEVPGYMPAMTMAFKVKGTNDLRGLQPGDSVSFRMVVTPDEGWIEQIRKTSGTTINQPPPIESFRRVRDVNPLKVGDLMPDYSLTNELGQAVSLSQFKGQALALTFIFTRCPFPDFCPRMSNNFSDAYKKLVSVAGSPTNWHLLTISFDPTYDTPAALKAYAQRFSYDARKWSFITGAMIEIDAITEQFGLAFSREGQSLNHNLRTVVIDAEGRVQRIVVGNEWKSDELVAEIVKAAKAGGSGGY